jgi:transcription termination/antitermination protein NusA
MDNLNQVMDQVARDKGISRKVLEAALEEAILAAAKKSFGIERNLRAEFNTEKGAVDLSQTIVTVVELHDIFNEISLSQCEEIGGDLAELEEGDELEFEIYYLEQDAEVAKEQDELYGDILRLKTHRRSFGRIAAQTAKQVIIQRIRDAERGIVYDEYKGRKGELVTGIVRRFERGNLIVDLGRAESILPMREQCPRENYRTGDRIQAYVIEVQEHSRGPQIVLSRATPALLVKLFELEVPEIHEGIVQIESAAREPGVRAKIAVSSNDRDVDPVGACVGMKGSRVQAVVQELRGEKIDIVPYSEEPATFVCNALQPAEVSRVLIDEANNTMEIIVPDDQLSLAIGRKGQNVRLASQLTRWRLDIHSESRIGEIKDRAWVSLKKVEGVSEFLIQALYNHGIRSAQQILESDRDFLVQFPGLDADNIASLLASAQQVAIDEEREEKEAQLSMERGKRAEYVAKDLNEMMALDAAGRVKTIRGMGETSSEALAEGGFNSVEAIAEAEVADLTEKAGLTEQKSKQLKYGARQRIKFEEEVKANVEEFGVVVVDGVAKSAAQINEEQEQEQEREQEQALQEQRRLEEERLAAQNKEQSADETPNVESPGDDASTQLEATE